MAAGRLDVLLGLNAAQFTSGLTKAQEDAEKFRRKMVSVGTAIGGLFTVAALRSATDAFMEQVRAIDDLAESAQALQLTAVELSNYRIAAEEAGVGTELFDASLTKLNVKISEAAAGGKEATRLFNALGIKVKDVAGNVRPTSEVLGEIASKFQRLETGPAKAALAVEIFGKAGAKLIPYLNQGADGLQRFSGLTNQTVEAAEKMQAEFDKMNASLTRMKNTILSGVIPAMNSLFKLSENSALGGAGQAGFELPAGLLEAIGGNVGLPGKDANALQAFVRGQEQHNRALAEGLKLSGAEAMEAALKGTVSAQKILDGLTDGGKKTKEQIDFNTQAFAKFVEGLSAGLEKTEAFSHVQEATLAIEQKRFGVLIPQQQELLLLLAQQLDMQKEYAARVGHNAELERQGNAERERFQANIDRLTGRGAAKEQARDLRDLDLAFETGQISFVQHMIGISSITDETTKSIEKTTEEAEQFALVMTSALGDLFKPGAELSAKSFFESLLTDTAKLTTQLLILKPLMEGLTEGFGGDKAKSAGGQQIAGWIGAAGELFKGFVGSFDAGTDFVPADGLAMVHRGERIVTAGENRNGGGRSIVINQTFYGTQDTRTMTQANADLTRKLSVANARNN